MNAGCLCLLPAEFQGLPEVQSAARSSSVLPDADYLIGAVDEANCVPPVDEFDCPCCKDACRSRRNLAKHLRQHYPLCLPETDKEIAHLHKFGINVCCQRA